MKWVFMLEIFFLCAGCASDDAQGPDYSEEISFTLVSSAGEGTISRSPGDANENKISRLDVFFYDKSGTCLYYPEKYDVLDEGGKMIVVIPEAASAGLLGTPVDLYVLANCELPRSDLEGRSLEQLQRIVQENRSTLNPDPYVTQAAMLMDGLLETTIPSSGMGDLGTIRLKRAAAKVVVNITGVDIEGYTATEAYIRLNNYLDKTTLGNDAPYYTPREEDYKQAAYRATKLPGTSTGAAGPFYSYANDWSSGPSRESYVTIAVKWQKEDPGGEEPRMYYYRIPFDYIPFEPGDGNKHRLRRNYIYTFQVKINELGGLDPENGINLNPNFELKDWTTEEVEVKLSMWDYLFVEEKYVEMHDVTDRTIGYTSSRPVSLTVDSVFYYEYLYSGEINVVKRDPGTESYPKFDITGNSIEISCKVPVNYVPNYMDFTVSHEKGFAQQVRVVQYPRQYITSEFSDLGKIDIPWYKDEGNWKSPYDQGFKDYWTNDGNGDATQQNFNLYTVTTTSTGPGDNFVLGGNMMTTEMNEPAGRQIRITKMDAVTNRMVSPKFVIASQRGIWAPTHFHEHGRFRCAIYREGPYGRGTWRMPTEAEMLLIAGLQLDTNSAIKGLFSPQGTHKTWWTSRMLGTDWFNAVNMETGSVEATANSSTRCVHDVWMDP